MASRKKQRQAASEWAWGGGMDTGMFWFGDMNAWGAFPSIPEVFQKPRPAIFSVSRLWTERLAFIRKICELREAIYSHSFSIVARDKKDVKAVEQWWRKNEQDARRFNREVWQEWIIQRNVIAIWRPNRPPMIYPAEHCTYDDALGIEQLSFTHGLPAATVDTLPGLSRAERAALRVGDTIKISRQQDYNSSKLFLFEVVKRSRIGAGLAWPEIRTLFNCVQTWDALEVADWQLSDTMRTVYEMHKIGHETRYGPQAGGKANFLKKERRMAIQRIIKNDKKLVARAIQLIVNWDHEVDYPRPDPKHFGKNRYESALQTLLFWSMPIGQMLFSQAVNPYLMPLLKAQTSSQRDYVRPFIESVLRKTLKMPDTAMVFYGDDVLWDSRVLAELIKGSMAAGPMSQETFMQKAGLTDPATERARKESESELAAHIVEPAFDAAHGAIEKAGGHPGGPNKKPRESK